MGRVILIGHFDETIELCEKCGCDIVGYVDEIDRGSFTYLGNDESFLNDYINYVDIPLVITPDNPNTRGRLFEIYHKCGFGFKTLIAPDAIVSRSASVSEGCVIQSLCNVSSNVFLGSGVKLNTASNVMHDVHIDDYSVIAPNAVLLGYAKVGKKTYIGANSTVLPGLRIANSSIVGAGAVVTKNVPNGITVVGVPAKRLKKEK